MEISTDIYDELNNISSVLAAIDKKNVFSVPEGYFEVLSIDVLKQINTGSDEAGKGKLSVPDGYFENLSSSVLNQVKSLNEGAGNELRALSPMLYSIQNENVFEVPPGYFKSLEENILNKIITKPAAKIVELKKRDSIWKYAAAAVVTGFIGLSALINYNSSQPAPAGYDNEITSSFKIAAEYKNEHQINAAIAMLPDAAIISYLERTGTDIDNEVLSTSIDENELPSTNDYLINEKTLEIYLNQIEQNSKN
jgi:hypothetical protein